MENTVILKLIKQLNTALDSHRNRFFEKYNLTSSQTDVLMYIFMNYKNIVINQKDIEIFLKLKNPTVTGILSRLEKKDFIKRDISILDKRHKEIILTQKSKNISEEISKDMKKDIKILLKKISENEIDLLKQLLLKIIKNIPE